MASIRFLEKQIIEKIAAGEVIVNPAAVVKELVENSIDANSKNIEIETDGGGKTLIRVIDDGDGIETEDLGVAFERYATSKIADSIEEIQTLGFRGEALSSIAAVSSIRASSRHKESEKGLAVSLKAGELISSEARTMQQGTIIEVRSLFFNLPARLKNMKKDSSETQAIIDASGMLALSHPEVSIKLVCDGKTLFHTNGDGLFESAATSIYGKKFVSSCIPVEFDEHPLYIQGLLISPAFIEAVPKRAVFINGRYVKSQTVNRAVDQAYFDACGKKGASMVLYLALPHKYVDVNVHPSKTDVQLSNESLITMLIKQAVTNSLSSVYVARQSAIEPEKTSVAMPVFEKAQEYFPAQAQAFQSSLGDSLLNDGLAADAIEAEPAFESLQKQTLAALSHMSYIGCAFGLYALLESNEAIYVVDTHAAHERVLYEAYLDSYNSKSISSQPLLVPVMLNMPPSQYQAIVSCTDDFNSIGYEITDMGDGSIAVRSVPSALSSAAVDNLLYSLADDLSSSGLDGFGQTRSEALIKKACHSAVRGDANISESELRPLLKSLAEASVPFTCPHGRPIISTISMKSFMRAFERIN